MFSDGKSDTDQSYRWRGQYTNIFFLHIGKRLPMESKRLDKARPIAGPGKTLRFVNYATDYL